MPTDNPNDPNRVTDARSPVREERPPVAEPLEPGLALCLSGGGYRAMVFHAGVLWRLNEAGYLPRLDRVSSVSGGSITAGVLAQHWGQLAFNCGYAVCDAALRTHVDPQVSTPAGFPYPDRGV